MDSPAPLAARHASDAAGAAHLRVCDVAQAQLIQHALNGHLQGWEEWVPSADVSAVRVSRRSLVASCT